MRNKQSRAAFPCEIAILELRAELTAVKHTLGTLIGWMVQSANSPIRRDEAEKLLKALSAGDART